MGSRFITRYYIHNKVKCQVKCDSLPSIDETFSYCTNWSVLDSSSHNTFFHFRPLIYNTLTTQWISLARTARFVKSTVFPLARTTSKGMLCSPIPVASQSTPGSLESALSGKLSAKDCTPLTPIYSRAVCTQCLAGPEARWSPPQLWDEKWQESLTSLSSR